MKIAIAMLSSTDIQGIYYTLTQGTEHQCVPWDIQHKTIYDFLYEHKPDILITKRNTIQPFFYEALQKYSTKLVILEDINLQPAGNTLAFQPQDPDPLYVSDVLFINIEPNLDKNFFKCLKWLNSSKYIFKSVGIHKLPLPTYLGVPSLDDIKRFLASTKICVIYREQGLYDAACMKTFCISNHLNKLFPDFSNIEEFQQHIDFFYENDTARQMHIDKAYNYIMSNNTYLDRTNEVLQWAQTNESDAVRMDFLESIE